MIYFRRIKETDAEFILSLRLNPELNKFLCKTDSSLEKQREWIRERPPGDYYFIIEEDGKRIGTVAIYDINIKEKTFEWGRWVISKEAPFYIAIVSYLFIYEYAFNILNLEKALFSVNNLNTTVIEFNKVAGAAVRKKGERGTFFVCDRKGFEYAQKKYKKYYRIWKMEPL